MRLLPRKKLLVMCDDLADPLWIKNGRVMVHLDSYPLSDELKADLRAWAKSYDDASRGWKSEGEEIDEEAFDAEGRRLWRLVAAELGPRYRVGFFSEVTGERYWNLDGPGA